MPASGDKIYITKTGKAVGWTRNIRTRDMLMVEPGSVEPFSINIF
jgi:hypothetical protein